MVVLAEVVWWARVSSSDNDRDVFGLTLGSASFGMRDHWVILEDMLRCLRAPLKARVKAYCTWLLDVSYECLPHCQRKRW